MPLSSSTPVIIDNYVSFKVDINGDNQPDMNVNPLLSRNFYEIPPIVYNPIFIDDISFPNGKNFAPSIGEKIYFCIKSNKISAFRAIIYNLRGEKVNEAKVALNQDIEGYKKFQWDGINIEGEQVPFGIYIVRFLSDDKELSYKEAIVVIK
jgi:hypothetical protein